MFPKESQPWRPIAGLRWHRALARIISRGLKPVVYWIARAGKARHRSHRQRCRAVPRSTGGRRASLVYLPGVTFATVFCSTGFFTENSAEREMVTFDSKSVALTSRVYFPGARVARGKSRSMVT